MKSKSGTAIGKLPYLVVVITTVVLAASVALAENNSTAWGSSSWFDWSDFRGAAGLRVFLAKQANGSISVGDKEVSFSNSKYAFTSDPEPFREFWAVLYVDRLGLRLNVEDYAFRGRREDPLNLTVSELQASASRMGLDLDIIRYPFARLGINYDYYLNAITFNDNSDPNNQTTFTGGSPMAIGLHGLAIPFRIREVPVILTGRVQVPIPFLNRANESKMTDWQISAGLRPSIWDISPCGHSTFSFAIEGGYRVINMSSKLQVTTGTVLGNPEVNIQGKWQGAFVEIGFFY